jgi:hypothetical protein
MISDRFCLRILQAGLFASLLTACGQESAAGTRPLVVSMQMRPEPLAH